MLMPGDDIKGISCNKLCYQMKQTKVISAQHFLISRLLKKREALKKTFCNSLSVTRTALSQSLLFAMHLMQGRAVL